MARNLKHSKIKNTGILFELLTRQITADVLAGKTSKSVQLVKKFFNENTELGKELELYRILSEKHYHSENRADYLLEAVIKSRRKLSNSSLRREKYNLIKQIKENYNVNQSESSQEQFKPDHIVNSKVTILEHITNKKSSNGKIQEQMMNEYGKSDKDLRLLAYQILVDKFNKKYKNLDESQRKLLKNYGFLSRVVDIY